MAGSIDFLIPIALCPNSRTGPVLASSAALLTLAWITVLLRVWTRSYILRSVGPDDVTTFCAAICYTVYCAAIIVILGDEVGNTALTSKQLTKDVNLLIVAETFYTITMIFLKISLGLFFLRIMFQKSYRYTIFVVMFLSTLVGVMYFFFIIFQCGTPVGGTTFWYRFLAHQCVPDTAVLAMGYTHAVTIALTDIIFAVLPVVFLSRAGFGTRKKAVVGSILAIGAVGGVASIVRVTYIKALTKPNFDFLCQILSLALWSGIEPGLGLIAASLATLRPLLRSVTHTVESWSRTGNTTDNQSRTQSRPYAEDRSKPRQNSGFSVLDEEDTHINSTSMDWDSAAAKVPHGSSGAVRDDHSSKDAETNTPQKPSWWKLPTQPTGPMAELGAEAGDIRLASMTLREKVDLEAGPALAGG